MVFGIRFGICDWKQPLTKGIHSIYSLSDSSQTIFLRTPCSKLHQLFVGMQDFKKLISIFRFHSPLVNSGFRLKLFWPCFFPVREFRAGLIWKSLCKRFELKLIELLCRVFYYCYLTAPEGEYLCLTSMSSCFFLPADSEILDRFWKIGIK